MRRGDIYRVELNPTYGHEQRGLRPVVVVSPDAFNKATGVPIVAPITAGGEFSRRNGFAVPLSGIKTVGVVLCDQVRTLDLKARDAKKIDRLPDEIVQEVLARLAAIFE